MLAAAARTSSAWRRVDRGARPVLQRGADRRARSSPIFAPRCRVASSTSTTTARSDGTGDDRAQRRRDRAPRGASRQGRRHAADVRRDRRGHLRRDRRRRHVRRDARARDGRARSSRDDLDMVTACATTASASRLSARPPVRQPRLQRAAGHAVRRAPDRHVLRLSRDVATLREVVSGRRRADSRSRRSSRCTRSSCGCPPARSCTSYFERPDGSTSKLSTYRDGMRILLHDGDAVPRRAAAAVLLRRIRRRCSPRRDSILGGGVVVEYMETRPRAAAADGGARDRA